MSDNAIILKDFDGEKFHLSKPKDTDLVLFGFQGIVFDKVRIITEHDFVYYSMVSLIDLIRGGTTLVRRSCFETLDGIIPYDKEISRYMKYYLITYAEYTKLTPQEFHIYMSENRGYSINEIMRQIEIRRKELLPELFG